MNLAIRPLIPLIIATSVCLNTALGDGTDDARAFLDNELAALVEVVNSDSLSPDAKRALIERQIARRLALGHMASESLGAQISKFSQQEFADFSKAFETHLLHSYLDRAASFRGDGVEIVDAKADPESGIVVVSTLGGVRGKRPAIAGRDSSGRAQVDYELSRLNDEWRITRIVIDGLDVSANFRAQFRSALNRRDPATIVKQIQKSNSRKERSNPFR